MLSVMKESLDFYGREFGPYHLPSAHDRILPSPPSWHQHHRLLRRHGFPQDGALKADPSKIDMVTFVTAHEIAHQM